MSLSPSGVRWYEGYHRIVASGQFSVEETECLRFGVRYDASGILPGYPCIDCQEVTGEVQPQLFRHGGLVTPEIMAARQAAVDYHIKRRLTNHQIAAALGISVRTADRYRVSSEYGHIPSRNVYDPDRRKRNEKGHFVLTEEKRKFIAESRANGMSYYRLRAEFGHDIETVKRVEEEERAKGAASSRIAVQAGV